MGQGAGPVGEPGTIDATTGRPYAAAARGLCVALAAGAAGLVLADQYISLCSLEAWAVRDNGGHLTLCRLLGGGLRPNVDFAYSYGPATVLLNYTWGLAWGGGWESFLALQLLLRAVLLGLYLAVLRALRLPLYGTALSIAALPLFFGFEWSIAHAAEKIGLVAAGLALVGRRPAAALLACSVAAAFRPACAIPTGAAVAAWYAVELWRGGAGWRQSAQLFARFLAPAAAAQVLVAAAYVACFGPASFAGTVLPLAGARMYSGMGRGGQWEGLAQFFPPDQNWKGYLLANPSHARPVLLFVLLAVPLGCLARVIRGPSGSAQEGKGAAWLGIGCIGLAVGVSFFLTYSSGIFYHYYTILFWFGLPAILGLAPRRFRGIAVGLFLVLAGNLSLSLAYKTLRSLPSYAAAFSPPQLHVTPDQEADLTRVREILAGAPAPVLTVMGEAQLLGDHGIRVDPNPYWCLRRRFNLQSELDAIQMSLRNHRYAVIHASDTKAFDVTEGIVYTVVYEGPFLSVIALK